MQKDSVVANNINEAEEKNGMVYVTYIVYIIAKLAIFL